MLFEILMHVVLHHCLQNSYYPKNNLNHVFLIFLVHFLQVGVQSYI